MAETFTKLFSSIVDSSVWAESHTTVRVWVTMLAKCDRKGRVFAAIPGLANAARVTLDECEHALHTFQQPDKYSRTPDNEGRRIQEIAGGWLLLNHAHYRELRDEEDRKEYQARWARGKRAAESSGVDTSTKSTAVDSVDIKSTHADADADADAKKEPPPIPALAGAYTQAFLAFWDAYPGSNKGSKKNAFKKWQSDKLFNHVDKLIEDVRRREREHGPWVKNSGQFIPMVQTYINGALWDTDIEPIRADGAKQGFRAAAELHNEAAAQRFIEQEGDE